MTKRISAKDALKVYPLHVALLYQAYRALERSEWRAPDLERPPTHLIEALARALDKADALPRADQMRRILDGK